MSKKSGILGAIIFLVLVALSAVFGVDLVAEFEAAQASVQESADVPATAVASAGTRHDWYEIYFTDPTCPPEAGRVGGLDDIIARDILAAEKQIDVAAFDLDAGPIVQALIDKERERGVTVRVVTDSDNGDLASIRRLRRAGISVPEDKRRALMHNKFIVIDGRVVWTGSLNFTSNGVYCNDNHVVRMESPRLAANYLAEMDEMYVDRLFGPDSPENTPHNTLQIGGIQVENYFAPETELSPTIARTLVRAQDEILFLAFSFTDDVIGEALLGRADAGVSVRGVFERTGADTAFSYYPIMAILKRPNIQVLLDGNPNVMHHKMIIIDRKTVLFGSFNFSESANRSNDENIVIVYDPTFASYFVEEFEAVWAAAEAAGNK